MNGLRMAAIAIMVAGVLALGYGGFSYTKDTTALKVGPIELKVQEHKTINVPVWAGIAAIVAGGLIVVVSGRKN